MKRFGILNAVLLVLIALAAWRTIDVWKRGAPERTLPAEPPGRQAMEGLPPVGRKPALPQMVSTIADKDLFDQSRKPSEIAAPAPVATPAAPPPTLKLSGVIVVGSQREVLLIDTAQGNKQLRMREGEELWGYKIGHIETEQISLVGPGGEETVLPLLIDKNKGPKKGFGPAGQPVANPPPGQQGAPGGGLRPPRGPAPGAPQPVAPAQAGRATGGITPADPGADARQRAESARERLKRMRAEAAHQ